MSKTAPESVSRRFSLAHLALLIPWVALVIDAWAPIRDNSFLWHIRAGELQANEVRVLTEDPFSFTMLGADWRTQSWLADLFYAWGEHLSGLGFVPWMLICTSIVFFLAVGLIAYRFSQSVSSTVVVLLLTTVLLISFLVPRPVIFSFVLFPLVILGWTIPRYRWTIPFLMWIWASVHGSFILALVYIGITLIVEAEWKWLPTVILAGLMTLMTAHGFGVIQILLDFSEARDTLSLLTEWRKPELASAVFLPFVIGLLILVLGAFRQRIDLRHLLLIVPFVALGLGAMRAVPPAWIALIPLIALALGNVRIGANLRFGSSSAAIFGIVVLVVPLFLRSDASLDEMRFPIEAAESLTDANTYHDDRVGGYLIYSDGPERLVYIDDRAELYLDRMAEFVAVRDGELPWEPVFERDGIEQALLRLDDRMVGELTQAGWSSTHEDAHFIVLAP